MCVAVDSAGNTVSSINPTGGAGTWSVDPVDGLSLSSISCASTAICTAVDSWGGVLIGTSLGYTPPPPPPASGPPALSVAHRATVRGDSIRLRLSCKGATGAKCVARVALAVRLSHQRHAKAKVFGRHTFVVVAGHSRTITVRLDKSGAKVLKARRALAVQVTVTQGPRVRFHRTFKVHYVAPKASPRHGTVLGGSGGVGA